MSTDNTFPYFISGNFDDNAAGSQIARLVRDGGDARRLLVPLQELAEYAECEVITRKLEEILLKWDSPDFGRLADKALGLLSELDEAFQAKGGIDLMDFGAQRVPQEALCTAIDLRMLALTCGKIEKSEQVTSA